MSVSATYLVVPCSDATEDGFRVCVKTGGSELSPEGTAESSQGCSPVVQPLNSLTSSCACVPVSRIQPHRDGSECVRCEAGTPISCPRRSICGRGREKTCDPHLLSSFRCAAASR